MKAFEDRDPAFADSLIVFCLRGDSPADTAHLPQTEEIAQGAMPVCIPIGYEIRLCQEVTKVFSQDPFEKEGDLRATLSEIIFRKLSTNMLRTVFFQPQKSAIFG